MNGKSFDVCIDIAMASLIIVPVHIMSCFVISMVPYFDHSSRLRKVVTVVWVVVTEWLEEIQESRLGDIA